jgi:hypothetical protein
VLSEFIARRNPVEDSVHPLCGRRFPDEKDQDRIDQIRDARREDDLRADEGVNSVERRIILSQLEPSVVKRLGIQE